MRNWKYLLQAFVTLIILWYLTQIIPLHSVYESILNSDVKWFAAALALIAISLFSMSVRMKLMMDQQKIDIQLWQVFRVRLISFYYKLFIPGGTLANIGILFYKFTQINKEKKPEIISTIMFDRILATIGLCFVGLLCLFFAKPNLPLVLTYSIFILFTSLLILIILLSNTTFSNIIEHKLQKSNNKLTSKLLKLVATVKEFQKLTTVHILYLVILSILPHIFGIFAFTALSTSMDLNLSLLDWGWIRSIVIIGTMLPISLAGIGIRDGILIYILHQYSISADTAWALSFLLFAATALWPALLGLTLELSSSGRKRNNTPI
jgi:uncharacterized protein (TIRG00374 family)